MTGLTYLQNLYAVTALVFQIALVIHFALRKWAFAAYIMPYGWIIYALSIPGALAGIFLLTGGMAWGFWLGGFIFLVWAIYGYIVEYRLGIQWRSPIRWSFLGPYVLLYLATVMFYWWPLALIRKPLWYVAAALFVVSTVLNVISHKGAEVHTR